jgi:hypothetical protein
VTAGDIAAAGLAAVLAVAAVAKLIERDGTRESLRGFGVAEALVPTMAIAVPVVEAALAVLLLVPATTGFAAGGALVLLLAFTGAIARALAGGRPGDCRCFGQLTAGRVGYGALVRNALLVALAATVCVQEVAR